MAELSLPCAQVISTNVDIAVVAPQYRIYKAEEVQSVIDRLS